MEENYQKTTIIYGQLHINNATVVFKCHNKQIGYGILEYAYHGNTIGIGE